MEILSSVMSHWQGAVAVVLVLGGLIFFHELGHFAFARFFGIGVRTFSLGFGPRLVSRRFGDTDYCLSAIPLGGYVAIVGQGGVEEELQTDKNDERVYEPHEFFYNAAAWKRLLVIAAGPVTNLILAWVIYSVLAFSLGSSYLLPDVGRVFPESPASIAGIVDNDRIVRINDTEIAQWNQITEAVAASNGAELAIVILRNNEERLIHLMPKISERTTIFGEKEQAWLVGIEASGKFGHNPLGAGKALQEGLRQTWNTISFTVEGIGKLVQRVIPADNLGGPIAIAQVIGSQAEEGLVDVLLVAAIISVSLGLLNLLPIPILDGGHILFILIEMVTRRQPSLAVQEYSARVGVVLLVSLMVFATWNDLVRLLS